MIIVKMDTLFPQDWHSPEDSAVRSGAGAVQRCTEAMVPDIILVQEHHLDEDKINKIGSICPGNWTNTWSAATGDMQIQGGVLIAMKAKFKFIVDCTGMGSLIEGRFVYIRIKHSCGHLGILNIYAPNLAAERQEFWLQLVAKKPNVELWIIGGDFNMVEHPEDRRGNANGTAQGAEKYAWDKFCLAYNVLDCWNALNFQMQK